MDISKLVHSSPTPTPSYDLYDNRTNPSKRRKLNHLSPSYSSHSAGRDIQYVGYPILEYATERATSTYVEDSGNDLRCEAVSSLEIHDYQNVVHEQASYTTISAHWSVPYSEQTPSTGSSQARHGSDVQTLSRALSPTASQSSATPDECTGYRSDQMICYGMLIEIGLSDSIDSDSLERPIILPWTGSNVLLANDGRRCFGKLPSRLLQIMQTLASSTSIQFEVVIKHRSPAPLETISPRDTRRTGPETRLNPGSSADIVLYGLMEDALDVGDWLSQCEIYLQPPVCASRDVPYRNPQCLDFDDQDVVYTSEIEKAWTAEAIEHEAVADLWSDPEAQQDLEEAIQPSLIRTELHPHQKQALTFFQRREKGWNLDTSAPDIWKTYTDRVGRRWYRNIVCGVSQGEPPPVFRGGCLADPMGLGKTLFVLSLIAANPATASSLADTADAATRRVRATMIVVPASLVQVWETQIDRHYQPSTVKVLIYHGSHRRYYTDRFADYDIVITTYNCVAADHKAVKATSLAATPQTLFSAHWHRVVLDEAHVIRSKSTAISRAVRSLKADCRWAVTGTPIQNRLGDFASLLVFLKAHPFDKGKYFEAEISQPWKTQMNEDSLRRLQMLATTLCLRRPKATVDLTASHPIHIRVKLETTERDAYEAVKVGTIEFLDKQLESSGRQKAAYFGAFQRINDLRFICNLGTLAKRDRVKLKMDDEDDISRGGLSFAQQLDQFLGAPALICLICGSDLGETPEADHLDACFQQREPVVQHQFCRRCAASPSMTSSPHSRSKSETPSSNDPETGTSAQPLLSSKVRALVRYLEKTQRNDKCVVFSYWTATLDLIQVGLYRAGISYCRYDGSLTRTKRDAVLSTFDRDMSIKVLLISISCGGQGLDVTIANHAILFEPQWNPMLEEQAFSRVHRIGQVKLVYLVRFVVQESFEENIVRLQERKRTLAGLVVDRQQLQGEDGRKLLMHLRELVG